MKPCDCTIGYMNDTEARLSNLQELADDASTYQRFLKEHGMLKGEPKSAREIIDARRGHLMRYKYCPFCGTLIDWNKIKNSIING